MPVELITVIITSVKDKRLTIQINKPVAEVFEFTTNPKNTPLWIDFIAVKETNEWPVKLGTVYRNKGSNSPWSEYEMTEFEENKTFTLSKKNGDYHVRYVFTPLTNSSTEMEYYEYVDKGDIEEPFTIEILQKLKEVVEKQ